MIWDFSDGVIYRTACMVTQISEQSCESVAKTIICEFNNVQKYEIDPLETYLSLHLKMASLHSGDKASESGFYKSAQYRVRQWGRGILLGLNYDTVEVRMVVTKSKVFILVHQESVGNQVPEQIAKIITNLLGGGYYTVKQVKDISWYREGLG